MENRVRVLIIMLTLSGMLQAQTGKEDFANPPIKFKPVPLWFWNNTEVNEDTLIDQLRQFTTKDGYGGCAILPFGRNFKPDYLSEDYFALYGKIIAEARKSGLQLSLYDEYGFPSGSMGAINADGIARLMNKYPDATVKRLDKIEYKIAGGAVFEKELPLGKLMSVVAMDTLSGKRISLLPQVQGSKIRWEVPAGEWKILFFVCVKDGDPNVDYLDPEAVKLFIEETHEAYYKRFASDFGRVITQTFFDEPTMYRAQGRMWTDDFNEKFTARHGFSPELLYPALWYDIGKDTQSARNYLFGFRSTLYSEGFMKTIQEWAAAHGILSTGHQDQEEILNPVSVSGDLMLCGKFMDVPGIDKIGGNRPAELFYKVISSSAYNWDKHLVMSETYGAMGNIPFKKMYYIAMEQYTKGINMLIPHAVWYNDKDVTFLPELSYRNELYRDSLPAFNQFLSRLNLLLQNDGTHVADIAMLYPIESLQGEHSLDGELGFYEGGVAIPNTDYIQVASFLTDSLGKDFTFLHPEVLSGKCRVKGRFLYLDNKKNKEKYQVLVVPGMKTISLANLKKIESFRRSGGNILFTTQLPSKSVEFGQDEKVRAIISKLMASGQSTSRSGKVFFIPQPSPSAINEALHACNLVFDVQFTAQKELNYIHKIYNKRSVYYFANLKDTVCDTNVELRGKIIPLLLDPHTGEQTNPMYAHKVFNGVTTTVVSLSLDACESVFVCEK